MYLETLISQDNFSKVFCNIYKIFYLIYRIDVFRRVYRFIEVLPIASGTFLGLAFLWCIGFCIDSVYIQSVFRFTYTKHLHWFLKEILSDKYGLLTIR